MTNKINGRDKEVYAYQLFAYSIVGYAILHNINEQQWNHGASLFTRITDCFKKINSDSELI